MDFYEALKFLATRVGVTLTPYKGRGESDKEKLYQINSLASRFYTYVLLNHPKGKKALQYIKEKRGLTLSTIKTFQLGYSPDVPFAMKQYLVDKHKISIKDLERVGLLYTKNGQRFDRFRGRIIFPLYDHRGNIVGFAGRVLPSQQITDLAKYINTPETEIYHKSKVLFGLNITRGDIKKSKKAVLVEGELDAISSWQVGIKNVVAIKGSSLTSEQASLLKRYADTLTLSLDADIAGDAAARRGIEIAEREGFELKVAKLKGFKDPDEAAQNDPEKLREILENAMNVWDFIIASIFERFGAEDGTQKAKVSREIVPYLAQIEDKIVQAHYIETVARKLKVPVDAVTEQINKLSSTTTTKPAVAVETQKSPVEGRRELLEERYLSVAFRRNPRILLNKETDKLISSPLAIKVLKEFKSHIKRQKEIFDPSLFAAELPSELVDGFVDMVLKDLKGLETETPERLERELELIKREIKVLDIKDKLEDTAKRIRELEKSKDKRQLESLQQEFGELTRSLNELETGKFKGIIL